MSFLLKDVSGVKFHISSLLNGKSILHGFSTRIGGVSEGVYESLNLRQAGPCPDDPSHVETNYHRFCAALGVDPDKLVLSRQVHEDTVRRVTLADVGRGLFAPIPDSADALVTDVPGINLIVFSADCILLLLWHPATRSIGAVHAGWRGAALDLPAKTVAEMGRLFGAEPAGIRVAIGAGIGPCCFETNSDVPDAMRNAFGPGVEPFIVSKGEKWMVDLKGLISWRLECVGLLRDNIDVCPLCTACHPELYWSHRRLGERRGLQGAMIGLRPLEAER